MVHTSVQLVGFWKLTYLHLQGCRFVPYTSSETTRHRWYRAASKYWISRAWLWFRAQPLQPWDTLWPWDICWDASPTPDANHQQDYNFLGSGKKNFTAHCYWEGYSIPGYISNHLLFETHVLLSLSPKKTSRPYRCFVFFMFSPIDIPRWWFQIFFIFTPGEMIHFDEHIFQMGWSHHLAFAFFFRRFASEPRDLGLHFVVLACVEISWGAMGGDFLSAAMRFSSLHPPKKKNGGGGWNIAL